MPNYKLHNAKWYSKLYLLVRAAIVIDKFGGEVQNMRSACNYGGRGHCVVIVSVPAVLSWGMGGHFCFGEVEIVVDLGCG